MSGTWVSLLRNYPSDINDRDEEGNENNKEREHFSSKLPSLEPGFKLVSDPGHDAFYSAHLSQDRIGITDTKIISTTLQSPFTGSACIHRYKQIN